MCEAWGDLSAYELVGRNAPAIQTIFVPNICLGCPHSRAALHAVGEAQPDRHDFRDLLVSEFYDILDAIGYSFACEYQFGGGACRELTLGV